MLYRQRPAGPALIAALCVLVFGVAVTTVLHQRVDVGEANESAVLFAGCLTCGSVGSLLVLAFARYQFTHLWKKPDPPFSEKKKQKRNARRHHSRRS